MAVQASSQLPDKISVGVVVLGDDLITCTTLHDCDSRISDCYGYLS